MYIAPSPLCGVKLDPDTLRRDKTNATKYEDCGLGKKALYLGAWGLSRIRYIPLIAVERVYKRLAVSKGYFESGKVYATISYLVIKYEGKEKVVRFTHEENLDLLLKQFAAETKIPVGKPK